MSASCVTWCLIGVVEWHNFASNEKLHKLTDSVIVRIIFGYLIFNAHAKELYRCRRNIQQWLTSRDVLNASLSISLSCWERHVALAVNVDSSEFKMRKSVKIISANAEALTISMQFQLAQSSNDDKFVPGVIASSGEQKEKLVQAASNAIFLFFRCLVEKKFKMIIFRDFRIS